jgi:hypothetical protein
MEHYRTAVVGIAGALALSRRVEVELDMIRQWIGDLALAVLLALPTLALSRPQPPVPERSPALVEQAALVDASMTERRFSLES